MFAIDTDVVIRYLVADDPGQSRRARALIEQQAVWISKTVLLESAWVLDAVYGFPQATVLDALEALLGLHNVQTEDERAVAEALQMSRAGLDFADALHVAGISASCAALLTFDRKLTKSRAAAKPVRLVP
jgi:predicted nucleic-acid-binding protein